MKNNEVLSRVITLTKELRKHNHLYYVMAEPSISDDEYDQLRKQLVCLEDKYPELIQPDSPIASVGGVSESFGDIHTHAVPMLSLSNAMNKEELEEFLNDIIAKAGSLSNPVEYVLEYKFDGLAASLTYEYGKLTLAVTRGDGTSGEIVTDQVRMISNVPTDLPELHNVPVFEIRGEVIMPLAGFKRYNEHALSNGQRVFSNPRNAAAGSLRQRSLGNARPLAFYAYSINQGIPEHIKTQSEVLTFADSIGFDIGHYEVMSDVTAAVTYTDIVSADLREYLPYEIDGIVVKLNSLADQVKLGSRARDPRWAIAFKFPAKMALTVLEDVTWQVGRMGQITPVGHVTPIQVGGVVISKVTLHNPTEIKRLDLRINDQVTITRAGDVIPKITKVWTDLRKADNTHINIPSKCPSCHSSLNMIEGEAMLFCSSGLICPKQLTGSLAHFASRECMNIDGLAEGTVTKLLSSNMISTFDTIYELKDKVAALKQLEGFGDKAISSLLSSIEKSKHTTLQRFIYALSMGNVGVGTSTRLERHYPTLQSFLSTTVDELTSIDDIGQITADKIYTFISNVNNLIIIEKLLSHGIVIVNSTYNSNEENTPKENWVITGSFSIPRHEIVDKLKKRGIAVTKSVNSKTDCLLVGGDDTTSSKYKKAKQLGIPIVTRF